MGQVFPQGDSSSHGDRTAAGNADIFGMPDDADGDATHVSGDPSPTESYQFPVQRQEEHPSASIAEDERTIVSRRPVAAPEEYFRSVPLAELASMLEQKQLDHFRVERMIGGGGMGAVFRGVDMRLDRTVAIKVIPASKGDPETLRRFRLEAQAAAKLDHPNIARVYYVGEAEQWNYIVFEFVDGINVRDLVAMHGPLGIDDAVYYTRQVAEALAHAHQRGVVHRDIKPSNLLVTDAGMIKVVDMGLARSAGLEQSTGDATASGVTLGTFDYISPEQARNPREADVRSDLYSLGCSLFFMLTGQPPFSEGTVLQKLLKHGSVPPPDPRGWRDDISDQVYAILMKMMAKQPSERYQQPADLVSDLLLLADVEDLPRSKLPGTVMFAPTIAQRSLLESNLPWLVAFAFLLGSTLWLMNVQASSGSVPLEDLRDAAAIESGPTVVLSGEDGNRQTAARVPDKNQELDARPVEGNPPGEIVRQRVVWSEFLPAGVEPSAWVQSFADALTASEASGQAVIEIRGRVVVDEPVEISTRSVTLMAAPGTTASIEFASSLVRRLQGGTAPLALRSGQLALSNLEIVFDGSKLDPNGGVEDRVGVIQVTGNSSVALSNCVMTLMDPVLANRFAFNETDDSRTASRVAAFLVDESSGGFSVAAPGLATMPIEDYRDVDITFDESFVRGYGTVIDLDTNLAIANRPEFTFRRSVFAVSESILRAGNVIAGSGTQVDRNIRADCESSTFFSAAGFVRLEFQDVRDPLLSVVRRSQNCVYETAPGGDAHITISGLEREDALAYLGRFEIYGDRNFYSESGTELLAVLSREGRRLLSFSLSSGARLEWFDEREIQRVLRWLEPDREFMENLSDVARERFRLPVSREVPGFQAESRSVPNTQL
ncbi:MAG: serine/threonine-protein kinase [Planctomycetota bacterium]